MKTDSLFKLNKLHFHFRFLSSGMFLALWAAKIQSSCILLIYWGQGAINPNWTCQDNAKAWCIVHYAPKTRNILLWQWLLNMNVSSHYFESLNLFSTNGCCSQQSTHLKFCIPQMARSSLYNFHEEPLLQYSGYLLIFLILSNGNSSGTRSKNKCILWRYSESHWPSM